MAHLPDDAFGRYVAMGAGRTYEGLAKLLGVSKRTVVRRAIAENWQARLAQVEEDAQRKTMERAVEDLAAIDERHLRTTRAIQARALEALKTMPINNGMAAVRALDVSVKLERAILGREKATPGPTRVQLISAAMAMPQELVDAALAVFRKAPLDKPKAVVAEPVVPPVLAPRVFGEN